MKIITLIENSEGTRGCAYEHGLSLYIETGRHRILADTGASDSIIDNASVLGIDLSSVDTVFLSHGHYDHCGGMMALSRVNTKAEVYIHTKADGEYYASEGDYIGIDRRIMKLDTVRVTDGFIRIDDEISIFDNVTARKLYPRSNLSLYKKQGGAYINDDFIHEQYLVLESAGKSVLISGCAHNGILNILDRFREIYSKCPDMVISGFHMMKPGDYTCEEAATVTAIGKELAGYDTVYCTGHCTGDKAIALLRPIMQDKLVILRTGLELTL